MRNTVPAALFFLFLSMTQDACAISWVSDLDKAMTESAKNGRPVMIDFYTGWCGWCKKLDKDTYSDKGVEELSRKFICVKIDGDKDRALIAKYGVRGYPTIIFLDKEGEVENVIAGYVNAGGMKEAMDKVLKSAPVSSRAIAGDLPKKMPAAPFRLGGVMNKSAIVNDKIVRVGDDVDGAKVIEIGRTSVKLNSSGKMVLLKLE